MKVKKMEMEWNKISSTCYKCFSFSLNAPSTETPVSHPIWGESLFLIFWANNWTPQYESKKGGKFLEQNELYRLQMVQFECPK